MCYTDEKISPRRGLTALAFSGEDNKMQRTMTKRVLTVAAAAVIGGLLSLAALAQTATRSVSITGSSPTSWEEAAQNAVAGANCSTCRLAEVEKLELGLEDGKVVEYRVRVQVE